MVYVCDNCGALFSRGSKQDQCPDCGKPMVRSANSVEQHEFASHVAELIRGNCKQQPRFPNLVETELSLLNCFAFKLPATALQIDSDMVVEITVDFGENAADRNDLTANVWARDIGGVAIGFLMSVHLPARQGEQPLEQMSRIFASLSENERFKVKLFDYITKRLEEGG